MLLAIGARPVRKRDHAVTIGVVAILLGLIVIGGISYTYMTRPALIEAVAKQVPDIRQLFDDTFREPRESGEPAYATAQPERHQAGANATDQPATALSHHSR